MRSASCLELGWLLGVADGVPVLTFVPALMIADAAPAGPGSGHCHSRRAVRVWAVRGYQAAELVAAAATRKGAPPRRLGKR
jgi:hypothetical protein